MNALGRFSLPQITLPRQVKRWLRWVAIPIGYVVLFCMFAYWSFPYERLEQRIVIGYNKSQSGSPAPKRMEIGDVTWAWRFPGIVLRDVELIGPAPRAQADGETPPREHSHIDEIYAGVSPLSFLFGTTAIDFSIKGFGGELSGEFTQSATQTQIELELSDVDPGQLPGVAELAQMPLTGSLSGSVDLLLPEGKYGAADGSIDLEIADLRIADGKSKIRGLLALPEIDAGSLILQAKAEQGRIEIERFDTKGSDLEAKVEGKVRLRDTLGASVAEQVTLSFKFSDAYRNKDENTRSLLGKPGDHAGLIDMAPQSKQAKQPDGSYSWRVLGSFSRLNFSPAKPVAKPGKAGAVPRRAPGGIAPGAAH
jgi:type II secretion system protein N